LVSFFVNGCELGATKSTSNPKIKLRTSIIFQQCISWANNIVLYHQDLIQKSPVAKAELTIICLSVLIILGNPVVPEVCKSIGFVIKPIQKIAYRFLKLVSFFYQTVGHSA
jgi:hypothetical protein